MTINEDLSPREKGVFKGSDPGELLSVSRNHDFDPAYEGWNSLRNALFLDFYDADGQNVFASFGLGTAKKIRDAIDAVVKDFEGELRSRAQDKAEEASEGITAIQEYFAANDVPVSGPTVGSELDELPTGTVIEFPYVAGRSDLEKRADGTWFVKTALLDMNAELRANAYDIFADVVDFARQLSAYDENGQFLVKGYIRADKDGVLDFTPASDGTWW